MSNKQLKLEVYRIYPTMYLSMGQGERLNWISGVAGNSSKILFSTLWKIIDKVVWQADNSKHSVCFSILWRKTANMSKLNV